jgi:hypothetical protein
MEENVRAIRYAGDLISVRKFLGGVPLTSICLRRYAADIWYIEPVWPLKGVALKASNRELPSDATVLVTSSN